MASTNTEMKKDVMGQGLIEICCMELTSFPLNKYGVDRI